MSEKTLILPRTHTLRIHATLFHEDPDLGKRTLVWATLTIGCFPTEKDADTWYHWFRIAAERHGATTATFMNSLWPNCRPMLDFDQATPDGLPWEVAAELHRLVPSRHRAREELRIARLQAYPLA